jgi:2-polyprenyl-3-methyl-5-hydroxy-6-metoxy-1,4-benzoquinol methylase
MSLGPAIRALFGPHERRIADLYRAMFIDLDDFLRQIRQWAPGAGRILEVGCGEGAVTERLARAFPDAEILAIDISPRTGRLYRGRDAGVTFRQATVQEVADEHPARFDLIVMSDVLHHVPHAVRHALLGAVGRALAPGGRFILKDWESAATPIHWACHASDRWITGDRVAHVTPAAATRLVTQAAPAIRPVAEGRVKPWRNNYAVVFAC